MKLFSPKKKKKKSKNQDLCVWKVNKAQIAGGMEH